MEIGLYLVQFVGQYFNLSTITEAESEEQAIRFAIANISSEYGWDLEEVSDEITATLEGVYA
jgi:hypothetical protein